MIIVLFLLFFFSSFFFGGKKGVLTNNYCFEHTNSPPPCSCNELAEGRTINIVKFKNKLPYIMYYWYIPSAEVQKGRAGKTVQPIHHHLLLDENLCIPSKGKFPEEN